MPDHPADPGRSVEVPLRRLERWLGGVTERHGQWTAVAGGAAHGTPTAGGAAYGTPALATDTHADGTPAGETPAAAGPADPPAWLLTAADGFRAVVHAPAWLPVVHPEPVTTLTDLSELAPSYGALLIRRAGYAVGLFDGTALVERKVGSRHIHGRTAAGGWSQQRYARRRANQADEIVDAAASAANRILGRAPAARGGAATAPPPAAVPAPAFLVTGGDRPLLVAVLAELTAPLGDLPVGAHLGIGTPDAAVLAAVPDRVLAVRIEISDP